MFLPKGGKCMKDDTGVVQCVVRVHLHFRCFQFTPPRVPDTGLMLCGAGIVYCFGMGYLMKIVSRVAKLCRVRSKE